MDLTADVTFTISRNEDRFGEIQVTGDLEVKDGGGKRGAD